MHYRNGREAKNGDKIRKIKGGYNYRGYCVYGKAKCFYMKDEDGNPANCFITLTAFKKWIDAIEKNNL